MDVLFYGNILEHTNGDKLFKAGSSLNIHELISELGRQYGEQFKDFLLGVETCFFLINGSGIMMTGGLDTELGPNDKIEVLPFAEAG